VIAKTKLADKYFAEGVTLVGDEYWMLTWYEKEILKFRADNLIFLEAVPAP